LTSTVYDFGSGNGFPGLVLGIIRPQVPVVLVERDVRKAEFLKHVAAELKLSNVTVFANDLTKLDKKSVSQGVTRALGSVSTLLIQMSKLFDKGAVLYHFKAESWSTEIARCPTQVFANWDIQPIGQYTLPDSTVGRCIVASRRI
jgi:16S rRNA (guanine527-N7)-methyltransferase